MRHARKYFRIFAGGLVGVQPDMPIWWTPQLPIIHVANPKSGCSSVNQSLKSAQAAAYVRAGVKYHRHPKAHSVDDCLHNVGLPPDQCRQRYLISTVRNPFARVLSGFLDKVSGKDQRVYGEFERGKPVHSFLDFLRALKRYKPARMDGHFRPQHFNLNYPTVAYDAVFFLENPAAISAFVSKIEPQFQLERFAPHASNAVSKLAMHYDATRLQIVRDVFAEDFERFGYSRHIDDVLAAPGSMIAEDRVISHDSPLPVPSREPRQAHAANTLEATLRFRRLVERRLI